MGKRILITAGGTGGHIFPAQGLAQQLSDHDVLFVAGGLGTNRYFDRTLFSFKEIACRPLSKPKGWLALVKGVWQSLKIIRAYQPDVVVGFGSYYTVATLLAAKLARVPVVLHEANSIPGKANKWFAPYVQAVGVHFPLTKTLLKGQVVEVGMPLRAGYQRVSVSREEALAYFQLDDQVSTMLVFGGSQGAKSINQWMQAWLKEENSWQGQCIHLTGDESIVPALQEQYRLKGIKACVKPFEKQMSLAWRAADFFLGRSGASTIAEAVEFEVPGILIPYPFATDNHQEKNADFLTSTVKGAIKILERNLNSKTLSEAIQSMMDSDRRRQKSQSIRAYKERQGRQDLCQLVLSIAEQSSKSL